MKIGEKWGAVALCVVLLLVLAGAGQFREDATAAKSRITCADDLAGGTLGGIAGRMPANSAKIFFESMLGRRLGAYEDYSGMDECLCALKSGRADAIWVTGLTADYLISGDDTLAVLDKSGMADIMNLPEGRFEFGMAVKNSKEGRAVKEGLDEAIKYLEDCGRLEEIRAEYIDNARSAKLFTSKDVVKETRVYSDLKDRNTWYIGITGAVLPLELIDSAGRPYGFCAMLADEIGVYLQRPVELVVLDNETVFSSLMSGKIDAVFCYGAGKITTEGSKNWLMTEPYCSCSGYEFLVLK